MKFCTNCGAKMQDEDVFCTNCGSKFPQQIMDDAKKTQGVAPRPAPAPAAAVNVGHTEKPSAVNQSSVSHLSAEAELQKAREILFPNGAIPDYTTALMHLVQAKKLGAKSQEMDQLMLVDLLYRTVDMMKQAEVSTHPELAKTASDMSVAHQSQAPYPVNPEHPAPHQGSSQHPSSYHPEGHGGTGHSKKSSGSQAANYMKAAAVGAVTGAVAQAATRAIMGQSGTSGAPTMPGVAANPSVYYVPDTGNTLTDADMLTLMSEGGSGTTGPVEEDYSPIPTAEAADVSYSGDDPSYTDDTSYADSDDSSYDDDGNDYVSDDDGYDADIDDESDSSPLDSFDSDDSDSGSFFSSDDDDGSFFDDLF